MNKVQWHKTQSMKRLANRRANRRWFRKERTVVAMKRSSWNRTAGLLASIHNECQPEIEKRREAEEFLMMPCRVHIF